MEFLILWICDSADSREVGRLTSIQADICLANLGGKAGALGAINFASKKIEEQDIQVKK